jgi:methyl-accepting chemotaxis protein
MANRAPTSTAPWSTWTRPWADHVAAVGGIGSSSDEIAAAADNTARRSEQQAASLEETAAALDEITATVRRASQGAGDAARVVGSTRVGRRALGRGGARRRGGHERHRAVVRSRSARSSG